MAVTDLARTDPMAAATPVFLTAGLGLESASLPPDDRWLYMMSLQRETEMSPRYILSDYVQESLAEAAYDKLEDGTFAGRIPSCEGVVAFGTTLRECEDELRSTLEDWILVGLKLDHPLPVIAGIDLNQQPIREPVDAL